MEKLIEKEEYFSQMPKLHQQIIGDRNKIISHNSKQHQVTISAHLDYNDGVGYDEYGDWNGK